MRILHVNKFLHRRGGAEAYLLDLAHQQAARGDEVAFFGMDHPENPPLPHDHRFPSRVELEPAPVELRERVRVAGRMIWSRSASRGIDQVIRDVRPDVAHLHNIYHQLSPSVLWSLRRAGVPMVMTLHDYKLICPSYRLLADGSVCEDCVGGSFRHAVRRRCKSGSRPASALLAFESTVHRRMRAYGPVGRFVAPSRFLADRMRFGGVPDHLLVVVPNFVDTSDLPDALPQGESVAYVGRLSWEKGVDTLIRAVGAAADVRLEVAGDGPERTRLESLAAEVAPGRVRFRGRLPRAEVLTLMAGAVATCLPARWHENQPIAVLESLGSGVPVISTDLGGLPEVVRHEETGLVAPADDVEAWTAALERIVTEPDLARLLGSRGRSLVREVHSVPRHLASVDRVYAAVRAEGDPRPGARSASSAP